MSVTKLRLNNQTRVTEDVDFGAKKITNLATPVDAADAATKDYVDNANASQGVIGAAEDGSYTDGLFVDFVPTTPTGTAIDRFNEVLKSLSPQPAPSFSSASFTNVGVSGKLSFGASNAIAGYTNVPALDINGSYSVAGNRKGIFNASTTITGVLANNVTPGYTNSRPYPNLAFGDSDAGTLHLEVNGVNLISVNLAVFAAGSQASSNGSFVNLSVASPVKFTNGDDFTVFKYRTGNYSIAPSDQRAGYNTVRVRHEYATGLFRDSVVYDFVVDNNVVATAFASETLNTLAMTGSRKISGVEYNTAGTAKYGVTVSNAYRNTYSQSGTAISHGVTNCSIAGEALPTAVTEADSVVLSNRTATVSATRLLNGSISVNSSLDRTVQTDLTSTGSSVSGILLDNTAETSTNTLITFNAEGRRISAGFSLTATNFGTGAAGSQPSPWDSTASLVGVDTNYNSGLLVYNGVLQYPKTNFAAITNGPVSNVNYSTASGLRTFIAYFYDSAAHSNFRLNVAGSSIAFVTVATGANANNLTMEILAPNTTKNASGTVVFKDAVLPHSGVDTDAGCYASTYGATVPTAWGCSLGAKNTSTSGNVIVIRITAAAAWTGNISSIGITWL